MLCHNSTDISINEDGAICGAHVLIVKQKAQNKDINES
jgi:hypothetical protein